MLYVTSFITTYCTVLAFCLGAVFASFIGCMGWRMCEGKSIRKGRSQCDTCGHVLGVLDLIPIFSYLWNRGHCRYCGASISKVNFYGEILMAGGFVLALWRFNTTPRLLLMLFFICILYLVSTTDIYKQIIPDGVLLVAILVRVFYVISDYYFQFDHVVDFVVEILPKPLWEELLELLIDGLAVSLPLLLLVLLMEKLWEKEAMGGGDIKLLFVTGVYIGWEQNLLALFFACIIGIGVALIQQKKADAYFPFGPSIAAGAVLSMIFGNTIINWYLSLF